MLKPFIFQESLGDTVNIVLNDRKRTRMIRSPSHSNDDIAERAYPLIERDAVSSIFLQPALLIFAVEVQVFTVSQIPLQFHCIFYRQPMQILNVKTAKKYLQWVVCKKCSETAVGFVTQ